MREWKLKTAHGIRHAYAWDAQSPWCMLQITHGMAEHMARYDAFAQYLCAKGVSVCGMDLAGHGKSVEEGQVKGYFAEKDGMDVVLGDMHALRESMQKDAAYVLMGHSMGSLLARNYAMRYGKGLDGLILSGTSGGLPAAGLVMRIARMEAKRTGAANPSQRLDTMAFGSYNKRTDARTKFDWLSREKGVVDAYIADENCGFLFTAQGFVDLLRITNGCTQNAWAQKLPKELPVLLFSGAMDPVGGYGKGVRKAETQLRAAGIHTTCILYEDARHEMLNETNKDEVYTDIYDWLKLHIKP